MLTRNTSAHSQSNYILDTNLLDLFPQGLNPIPTRNTSAHSQSISQEPSHLRNSLQPNSIQSGNALKQHGLYGRRLGRIGPRMIDIPCSHQLYMYIYIYIYIVLVACFPRPPGHGPWSWFPVLVPGLQPCASSSSFVPLKSNQAPYS